MKGTFIIDSIIVFVWRDETSTSTDFAREWGSMIPRSGNHDTKKGKRIHWSYVIFFTHGNTDTKYYMPPTYMEHIACGVINIWVCSPLNHQSIHTHTHTWYLIPTHLHEVPCFDHFGHGLAFLAQCSSLAGEVIWARYNKEQRMVINPVLSQLEVFFFLRFLTSLCRAGGKMGNKTKQRIFFSFRFFPSV